MNNSILEQPFVKLILDTARGNLAQDGTLAPVLFVNTGVAEIRVVALSLPATFEEKQAEFRRIGTQLQAHGETVLEAVFVSEGWVVRPQEAPGGLRLPPSQHPCRQEAIIIIGRNAPATYHTCVVQAFSWTAAKQPVWDKVSLAAYHEPVAEGNRAEGLLDDLFAAHQQR